jgi:hypothetical protein
MVKAVHVPCRMKDFGYLSEHVIAVAAKAIIASFHGSGPRYSYLLGGRPWRVVPM